MKKADRVKGYHMMTFGCITYARQAIDLFIEHRSAEDLSVLNSLLDQAALFLRILRTVEQVAIDADLLEAVGEINRDIAQFNHEYNEAVNPIGTVDVPAPDSHDHQIGVMQGENDTSCVEDASLAGEDEDCYAYYGACAIL